MISPIWVELLYKRLLKIGVNMSQILIVFLCAFSIAQARQFDSVLRELGMDKNPVYASVVSDVQTRDKKYLYRDIKLSHVTVGDISISTRRPLLSLSKKLPVIFMSTGFHVGKQTTQLVGDVGENVLASFDYGLNGLKQEIELINKYSKQIEKNGSLDAKNKMLKLVKKIIGDLPSHIDAIKKMPVQIATTLFWLKNQSNVDANRINLVAVSMGTQVMPLAQRIFEFHGGKIFASVLGYGGADVALIVEEILAKKLGRHELKVTQMIIRALMNGYDSKDHLPHLRSKFHLIVNAYDEEIFTTASIMQLEKLTPVNKEIIWTGGGHINASTSNLIIKFVNQVLTWGRKKVPLITEIVCLFSVSVRVILSVRPYL